MLTGRTLPNQERLSIVVATILLAYALAQSVNVANRIIPLHFVGVYIPISINFNNLVTLAVAGMTASGTDWLLRDHPNHNQRSAYPHLLLPALSAWSLNVILNNLAGTNVFWLVFSTGGALLILVIFAEYIALDSEDIRYPVAVALLNALSFAIFLALTVSLRSSEPRLILTLPVIAFAAGTLSLRIINLGDAKHWHLPQATACLVLLSQLAAALHYLPIQPISYGILLLGWLYAIISFIQNILHSPLSRRTLIEPISVILILWVLALWLN